MILALKPYPQPPQHIESGIVFAETVSEAYGLAGMKNPSWLEDQDESKYEILVRRWKRD